MPENKKREKTKEFTSSFGNKFMMQKMGIADFLDMMDQSEGESGKPARGKLYPEVLKNIVVNPPNMSPDDFEEEPFGEFAELDEVVTEAIRFQRGK